MIHFETRDKVSPSKQVAFQLFECSSLYSISFYPIQEVDYICVHPILFSYSTSLSPANNSMKIVV